MPGSGVGRSLPGDAAQRTGPNDSCTQRKKKKGIRPFGEMGRMPFCFGMGADTSRAQAGKSRMESGRKKLIWSGLCLFSVLQRAIGRRRGNWAGRRPNHHPSAALLMQAMAFKLRG